MNATATHRGTAQQIVDVPAILHNIETSRELKSMWEKYRKQFAYAAHIEYIPLLLIYPLLQRYFVSGIVVGSVKG